MTNKNKSLFKVLVNAVAKLPWLKESLTPTKGKMKPGKGFNKPVSIHSFDYLKELDDKEFDKLISLIFKQRGYSVSEKHEKRVDAVDVVLHMNNEATFIQYRHWREHHVDVAQIEELYTMLDTESARNGIVITSGIFTDDALDFAIGKKLLLINGVDLSQMVEALRTPNKNDNSCSDTKAEQSMDIQEEIKEEIKQEMPELEPLCPICSQKMIKRTAKKGKNAGNTFWGCSQFPNCRGVVSN